MYLAIYLVYFDFTLSLKFLNRYKNVIHRLSYFHQNFEYVQGGGHLHLWCQLRYKIQIHPKYEQFSLAKRSFIN